MQLAGRLFALACSWTALVVGFALLVPTAANARGAHTAVHIRQVSGQRAYEGRVMSPRHACVTDRRVFVYHEVTGPDKVVAHATSHRKGTWRAQVPVHQYRHSTFYYARIAPKHGDGARCAGAKSAYAQAF
jgi:hypothetical protein